MRRGRYSNQRSANAQKDNAKVVINIQKSFQIPIDATNTSNAIAINIWYLLRESNMFDAYRGMFDQVKISGITARISGLNGSSAITMANTPTICTAWDRNGIEAAINNPTYLSYQTVSSYSSAIISNWSPGNAFKITRRLYPSTLSEKSYYVSCGSLSVQEPSRNPAYSFVYQNGIDFKPLLLVGAYAGFATAAQQSIGLMIEFDVACVFRGLRRYSTASDNAASQISAMAGTFLDGQSGNVISASSTDNWTRVNNDGDVGNGEIPIKPE